MSLTNRPIRNIFLPLVVLFIGIWLRPILKKIPEPKLPKKKLNSINGKNLSSESCKILNNNNNKLKYCEDILFWKEVNLAIVSCDEGRPEWNTVMGPLKNPNPRGKIFSFNTNNENENEEINTNRKIKEIELNGFPKESDFHPLGIEIYKYNKTLARLFVVNHRRDKSTIEIFKIELIKSNLKLNWERSLIHNLIKTPNSLISINSNNLLISNDHYFNRRKNPIFHVIETWLTLRTGNIIQVKFNEIQNNYNNKINQQEQINNLNSSESGKLQVRKVITGIPFANGLALSQDGSTLVVASSMLHSLWYYHKIQNSIEELKTKEIINFTPIGSRWLNFAPDNLHFDNHNRLIVAGHPHGLTLLKFSKNLLNSKPAGSSIAIILHQNNNNNKFLNPHNTKVDQLFLDDGHFFASSTSAFILEKNQSESNQSKDKLFVIGLYQSGLLECDLS